MLRNITPMEDKLTKEEYNEVPVHYCTCCLSLDIRRSSEGDYCDDCGSTDTWVTSIQEWEEMYKNSYGKNFLNLKNKVWKN